MKTVNNMQQKGYSLYDIRFWPFLACFSTKSFITWHTRVQQLYCHKL